MSGIINIRAALETALAGMSPTLQTAWENDGFKPAGNVPYQKAYLLPAQPDNSEYGTRRREQGIFQITLMYPLNKGSAEVAARAEMLQATFERGQTFESGGVVVVIDKTPEISAGQRDGDRWAVPVKIRWHSHI